MATNFNPEINTQSVRGTYDVRGGEAALRWPPRPAGCLR